MTSNRGGQWKKTLTGGMEMHTQKQARKNYRVTRTTGAAHDESFRQWARRVYRYSTEELSPKLLRVVRGAP